MAQVESPFNPQLPQKEEETYLNYSRGADAPNPVRTGPANAVDNSTANAGALFTAAVGAKDTLYKNRIREEATEDVDTLRDTWIGVGAVNSNQPGIPVDIEVQSQRMAAMVSTMKERPGSANHYYMMLNNISRSLRSKYPGYREYIDNVVSDLTGGTPANILQRNMEAQANAAEPGKFNVEKERQEYINMWSKSGYPLPPNYQEMTLDNLRSGFNDYAVAFGQIQQEESRLKLKSAQKADISKESGETFNKKVNTRISAAVYPAVQEFRNKMTDLLKNNKTISGPQQQALVQEALALKSQVMSIFEDTLADDPEGVYQTIPSDTLKGYRQNYIDSMDMLTSALMSGSPDMVRAINNNFDMTSKAAQANVINNSEFLQKMSVLRNIAGDEAVNQLLQLPANPNDPNDGRRNINVLQEQLINLKMMDTVNPPKGGEPQAMVNRMDQYANSTDPNPAASMRIHIDKLPKILTDSKQPMQFRMNVAKSMFGVDNREFINFFSKKDNPIARKDSGLTQVGLFQQMTSPEIAKAMIELRDQTGGQDIYNSYIQWREYTFNTLFKQELDTIRDVPANDQSLNLQIDTKTGRIITQDRFSDGWTPIFNWTAETKQTVARINGMIDAMTPAWKAEGLNPGEEAQKLYLNASIDFNAPKNPSLGEGIKNAIARFVATGGDPETESLRMMNARQLAKQYLFAPFIDAYKGVTGNDVRVQRGTAQPVTGSRQIEESQGNGEPLGETPALDGAVLRDGGPASVINAEAPPPLPVSSRMKLSDENEPVNARLQFTNPAFGGAISGMNPNFDPVTARANELRETINLFNSTEDPQLKEILREEIKSLRGRGPLPGRMNMGYGLDDRQSSNVEDRRGESLSLKTRLMMLLQEYSGNPGITDIPTDEEIIEDPENADAYDMILDMLEKLGITPKNKQKE